MSLEITLLGPPEIMRDGTPIQLRGPKTLALLAYLLAAGTPCSRRQLVDLLYDDSADPRASLRWTLSHLRKGIGAEYILADRQTIQFDFDQPYTLDTEALAAGEAAVYRGEYLEGVYVQDAQLFMEWSLFERERWRSRYQSIIADRLEAAQERGAYERVVELGRQLLALDNLREDWHRVVMAAYARQGQRDAALAQYELCRNVLADELEVEPEEATQTLYEAIEAGDLFETGAADIVVVDPAPLPAYLDDGAELQAALPAVFVAREAEMDRLATRLEKTIQGQGQVAFLSGEAGAGKSSLADAFVRRALDDYPDLLAVWGRCNAYSGSGDAFLPFRTALAMLTGDVEREWEAGQVTTEQARRLWSALPQAAKALVEQAPDLVNHLIAGRPLLRRCATAAPHDAGWLHELQTLAGREASSPGEREQSQFFEQAAAFLHAFSRSRPLLVILDDLQWADAASLDLLFHLTREVGQSSIFFLGAYRPDEVALGRHSRITGQHEPHPLRKVLDELQRTFGEVVLDLDQAGAESGADFVDALLDTEPNRLNKRFRKAFLQRTDGHPLFAVELLRAMQERGDLVQDDNGYWVAEKNLNWATLPARVEGVIAERINRLEAELREMLTVASIEGEDFTAQVVARVREVNERGVVRQLSQELDRRHRLVGEQGPTQVGDQRLYRYRFRHSLFQQHLYNELGEIERELLHGDVGQVLEALYKGQEHTVAPQLAWHFAEAGENKKATCYLLLAGDTARNAYANDEAINHYERAIELLKEKHKYEQAARTLMKLGLTYHNAFAFHQARDAYDEAFKMRLKGEAKLSNLSLPQASRPLRLDWGSPATLDPHHVRDRFTWGIIDQLFSGLVSLTSNLDVAPDIAKSWEIHQGGQRYVFHLRHDVQWSDGRRLTADDVEYSWKRALDPDTESHWAGSLFPLKNAQSFFEKRILDNSQIGVKAEDDFTLIVDLERPATHFPYLLTTPIAKPLPRHAIMAYGDQWTESSNLVTNGPFMIDYWEKKKVMRLVRNSDHHGQAKGNVQEVQLSLNHWNADWTRGLHRYERDELDVFVLRTTKTTSTATEIIKQRYADEYTRAYGAAVIYVHFDVTRSPFDDPRIRKAFAMAIDQEQIAPLLSNESFTPAFGGIIPPGLPGHSPGIGLKCNPELARTLLAEAGYPQGRDFPSIYGTDWHPAWLSEHLIACWRENLGIDIEISPVNLDSLEQWKGTNRPHLAIEFPGADIPDPSNMLSHWAMSSVLAWDIPERAQLEKMADTAKSQKDRIAIYQEIDRLLIREAFIRPVAYLVRSFLVKPWVKNVSVSSLRPWNWKDVIIRPRNKTTQK